MDAELKAKWIEALRSGKYAQTQGKLAVRQKTTAAAYCCLGVLCVVAKKPIKAIDTSLDVDFMREIDLPFAAENRLVLMNDDEGNSFAEIADYIEANL